MKPNIAESYMRSAHVINESAGSAGTQRGYVKTTLMRYAKKVGISLNFDSKLGYDVYTLPQGTSIVSDGVGLKVLNTKGKEYVYYSTPKMDYKKALESALSLKEEVENLDEAKSNVLSSLKKDLKYAKADRKEYDGIETDNYGKKKLAYQWQVTLGDKKIKALEAAIKAYEEYEAANKEWSDKGSV